MHCNVASFEREIKLLKGLNPSKVLGSDDLHLRVLKELANELDRVFAHLVQQSLDTGDVSKKWLLANMYPLFQKVGVGVLLETILFVWYSAVALNPVCQTSNYNRAIDFVYS